LSIHDLGCDKVMQWLSLLDWDTSVQMRFARERIDVEALTMLSKDDLRGLGVARVGDQSKLNLWARKTMDAYLEQHARPEVPKADTSPVLPTPARPADPSAVSQPRTSPQPPKPMAQEEWSEIGDTFDHFDEQAHEINIFSGKNVHKHLGAVLDQIALWVLPPLFLLYVILEFSGVFMLAQGTGKLQLYSPVPSRPAIIEYIDKRADKCYRSIEKGAFAIDDFACKI